MGDSYVDDVCGPWKVGMKTALIDRKGTFHINETGRKPDYVIRTLLELENMKCFME